MILKIIIAFGALALVGIGLAVDKPVKNSVIEQRTHVETFVYPSLQDAAVISNYTEEDILQAIKTGQPVDSSYFAYTK